MEEEPEMEALVEDLEPNWVYYGEKLLLGLLLLSVAGMFSGIAAAIWQRVVRGY